MGLFDKLREAVESTGLVGGNEKEKKYYDIVLNLLLCVRHLKKEHMQKIITVKCNEDCDIPTLDKVLKKFKPVTEPKTGEIWYETSYEQLSKANRDDGGHSYFNKGEIYDICFADFKEEIRSKFKETFEVVKSNPSERILKQGISRIIDPLPSGYAGSDDYPNYRIAIKVIAEEISKLLFAGDCLIKEIVADEAISWLKYARENSKYEYIPRLYAFALRALHYAKSSEIDQEYSSIVLTDCHDAAYHSKIYQKRMEENPFEKEGILDAAAERIFESEIIIASSKINWYYWAMKNVKFIDAACYFAWLKISDECEQITDNVEDVVNTTHSYILNSDD